MHGKTSSSLPFGEMPGPRQLSRVLHPLNAVLLPSPCAVLSGADSLVEIAAHGVKERDVLRRFSPFAITPCHHPLPSPLANGTPSHERPGTILAALDAQAFQRCFIAWVSALQADLNGVVAIDGKTLRRSRNRAAGKDPLHMISAFAAGRHPVCGQRQVDGTSNAIAAIPGRLDVLHIEGALATLVTIDAMGCHPTHDAMGRHRALADGIVDRGGQYVVAVKGNRRALHGDVKLFLAEQGACDHASRQ